jgi:hypothetical protein
MPEPMPFDLWWSPSMKRLLTRHEDMDDEHLVWVVQGGHESLRHYLGTGPDSNPSMPDDAVQLVPDRDITSLEEELYNRAVAAESERDGLQARLGAVPNILRQHYLAWIECDHDKQMDNPQCACSKVDLGWHPTVGDAVNAWIEHVRAALQGDHAPASSS